VQAYPWARYKSVFFFVTHGTNDNYREQMKYPKDLSIPDEQQCISQKNYQAPTCSKPNWLVWFSSATNKNTPPLNRKPPSVAITGLRGGNKTQSTNIHWHRYRYLILPVGNQSYLESNAVHRNTTEKKKMTNWLHSYCHQPLPSQNPPNLSKYWLIQTIQQVEQ
jgi:hypothetical protein